MANGSDNGSVLSSPKGSANGNTPKHLDMLEWWLKNGRNLKLVAKHFGKSYSCIKNYARDEDWQGYVQRMAQRSIENHIGYQKRYYEILDIVAKVVQQYFEEQLVISEPKEALELLRLLQTDITSNRTQKLEVNTTGGEFTDALRTVDGLVELAQTAVGKLVESKPGDDGGVADESG